MNKFDIIKDEQTPAVPEITDVRDFISENKELIDSFLNYVKTLPNAAGLAANQASLNGERIMKRMFGKMDLNSNEWSIIINPIIKQKLGMVRTKSEGCLTWIGKTIVAERNHRIIVEYHTSDGEKKEIESVGFEAQIWQHEINHLNGIEEDVREGNVDIKNIKIERNVTCPCGSGKKYKKCCIE